MEGKNTGDLDFSSAQNGTGAENGTDADAKSIPTQAEVRNTQ
jgi:hypothetical protein